MLPWLISGSLALLCLLLFWPRFGAVSRWRRTRETAARVLREDALKHIHKAHVNGRRATLESVAGTLHIHLDHAAKVLADMEARGLVSFASGELQLTTVGREAALRIIRAHRLWESYLADQTGVAETEWHGRAEEQEHRLSPEHADAISAQLGHPTHDPHGDPIPTAGGVLAAENGEPLNTLAVDQPAVITHIEDEPETLYAQIAAEGLRPGMRLRILAKDAKAIRFWANGDEHVLAPVLANNISVVPLALSQIEEEAGFLSYLKPGEKARVIGLSTACRGAERRRLLDLGFVPGTEVEVEMVSPIGDPVAYRLRGTVIALRREPAGLIQIATLQPASA